MEKLTHRRALWLSQTRLTIRRADEFSLFSNGKIVVDIDPIGSLRTLHRRKPSTRSVTSIRYLVAAAFAVTSLPSRPQDSERYRACMAGAITQSEMNACASEEAARHDTQLNDWYRKVLSQVQSRPEAVAKIKDAERAPRAAPCLGSNGGRWYSAQAALG